MKRVYLLLLILSACYITTAHAVTPSTPPIPNNVVKENTVKKQKKGFFKKLSEKILLKKAYKMAQKMGLIDDCETIIKTNGDELSVKILEVNEATIKYKKCGLEDGPTFTIDKSNVFMIRYTNGEKEVITSIDNTSDQAKTVARYNDDEYGSGAFAGGLVLGFLLGLIGLLIAALAFQGIRKKKAINGALVGLALFLFIFIIVATSAG